MADILDFQKKKVEKENEELERDYDDADMVVADLTDELGELLTDYGLAERDESFAKDYFYIHEAIRSLVYNYYGLEHPFQNVVDEMIDTSYNDMTNTYNVYWKEKPTDEGHIEKILDSSGDIE